MTTTNLATYMEVKDYLTSRISAVPKKIPMGALFMPWQGMQAAPDQPYNEVYPGIILGDHSVSRDPVRLTDIGVTHIINCAMGPKFNQINTNEEYFSEAKIQFHGITATDIMTYKMAPHFDAAADFIEKALNTEGRVYVHCQSGVSRSATIVLAFLMLKRNNSLIDAVKTVRDKRQILPNDGFLKQLVALNDTLYGKTDS